MGIRFLQAIQNQSPLLVIICKQYLCRICTQIYCNRDDEYWSETRQTKEGKSAALQRKGELEHDESPSLRLYKQIVYKERRDKHPQVGRTQGYHSQQSIHYAQVIPIFYPLQRQRQPLKIAKFATFGTFNYSSDIFNY